MLKPPTVAAPAPAPEVLADFQEEATKLLRGVHERSGTSAELQTVLDYFRQQPTLRDNHLYPQVLKTEVHFIDLSAERPALPDKRKDLIAKHQGDPQLFEDYTRARAAGRLSSWPTVLAEWDAADARKDPRAQRLAIQGAFALCTAEENEKRPMLAQALPVLRNHDPGNLKSELAHAEAQRVFPTEPGSPKLRRLVAEGDQVKWTISDRGQLHFGPTTITHAVIGHPHRTVAAGQAYLFEMPGGRLSCCMLSNESGHFQPDASILETARQVFLTYGIDTPKGALTEFS